MRNPHLEVRSSGLAATAGDAAQPGALRVAREFGVDLSDHSARRFDTEAMEWADVILAMQGRHPASIRRTWPRSTSKVRLLGDFLYTKPYAIEDPWGHEDAVFRSVFTRIVQANERISQLLRP